MMEPAVPDYCLSTMSTDAGVEHGWSQIRNLIQFTSELIL